jgi:hypothetical protein
MLKAESDMPFAFIFAPLSFVFHLHFVLQQQQLITAPNRF